MKHALKCSETVTRLVLPYKDIFTTVYVLQAPEGVVVFDTATTVSDMEDHLLPLLEELGRRGEAVEYLTSSENDPCFRAELPECITCRYIGTGNTAYTTLTSLKLTPSYSPLRASMSSRSAAPRA